MLRQQLAIASLIGLVSCSSAAGAPGADPAGAATASGSGPDTAGVTVAGGRIEVVIGAGHLDLSRADLIAWISTAADAVTAYYGRFPVPRYRIVIQPVPDRAGVLSGTTWTTGRVRTRMLVGEHTSTDDLGRDWVMTHEMVHTAFPSQDDSHHWIEEGIATYVEPLARSWIGRYPAAKVWTDLVDGLPNGLPRKGDRGLDRTHTWGRTYWGGALFCLLADLEIRDRTKGRFGLVDALRGILAAGGSGRVDWPIERAFVEGDKAVGVPVLQELYRTMKHDPVTPDLDALWRDLGVAMRRGARAPGRTPSAATPGSQSPCAGGAPCGEFDEQAPRAATRRAISARPPGSYMK